MSTHTGGSPLSDGLTVKGRPGQAPRPGVPAGALTRAPSPGVLPATRVPLSIPALPPPLSLMPNWGGGGEQRKIPTTHRFAQSKSNTKAAPVSMETRLVKPTNKTQRETQARHHLPGPA